MSHFLKLLARHRLAASLLLLSLACNIAALSLPFMSMRKGLGKDSYTLLHSVSLLWSGGLYVLSILVVGFSILFPFAKLGILFWVIGSKDMEDRQRFWLRQVEHLGKWSMLDVFLISIILSLASNQFLVGAKPQLGLNLFIVAIIVSMTAGEIISRQRMPHPNTERDSTPRRGGLILLLSGITLITALSFPFLRIEDWLLKNREYSIITLVPALWTQGAWLASVVTAAFLIIAPLLVWVANLAAWRSPSHRPVPRQWTQLAQRWSMLDVFGLALLVFTIESDQLMKTEIHWGAPALATTLVLQMALVLILQQKVTPAAPKPNDVSTSR